MKKLITIFALSTILLTATASQANAGIFTYNVALSGGQTVPANASTGTGSAVVIVDDVLDTVSVTLSFSGLTGGAASAAHIHCCSAISGTAPVVIPFTGFPNTTSGTYSNTFTGVSVANITGIEAGLAYINIHNTVFPGGEIRGDIVTPEPASLSLMGLGILAICGAATRRRRKQQ